MRGNTGNKKVQLVLQHCCKTSWKAMLRALPPTFKSFSQQIKVAASCLNTDFWLDKITRESHHTQELRQLLQNKFALSR